ACEKISRNGEAELLGHLEIDDQLDLGRLNNWQISRLRSFEDARGVETNLAIGVHEIRTVADESARCRELAKGVASGNCMMCCERNDLIALVRKETIGGCQEGIRAPLFHRGERCVQFRRSACTQDIDLYCSRISRCVDLP